MSLGEIAGIGVCIFLVIIVGVFMGSRIDTIMSEKGHTESWFWRGFFLWPFIYRATLLEDYNDEYANIPYDENDTTSRIGMEESTYEKIDPESWQCVSCNRWNRRHVTMCKCGNSKANNKRLIKKLEGQTEESVADESDAAKNDGAELTNIEQSLVNLISKNPDGISGINIAKSFPKTVLPGQITGALDHICELGLVQKLDNGHYVKK